MSTHEGVRDRGDMDSGHLRARDDDDKPYSAQGQVPRSWGGLYVAAVGVLG